jgi:hypothetical protein
VPMTRQTHCRFVSVLVFIAMCAAVHTAAAQLPPEDVLYDKVLEVGRALKLTEVSQDRMEGVFVWRFNLSGSGPQACEAFFAWYLKRLGDDAVVQNDPGTWSCGRPLAPDERAKLDPKFTGEIRQLQKDFKARWLRLVGPAKLARPSAEEDKKLTQVLVGAQESATVASHEAAAQIPPDDVLYDKVLEVGRALDLTYVSQDRKDGLFVWRFPVSGSGAPGCEAFLIWYVKPVGANFVMLYDPAESSESCLKVARGDRAKVTRKVTDEIERVRQDFKTQWLRQVAPVKLTDPPPEMQKKVVAVLERVIKGGAGASQAR